VRLSFEWAGIVGWEPWNYTLKELYWAVTARRRDAWDQTSQVLAFISAHGGAKDVDAAALHPYRPGGRKRRGWADLFGAGRQMLAERRARQAEGNGRPEGV
jgi:hypothetical protein